MQMQKKPARESALIHAVQQIRPNLKMFIIMHVARYFITVDGSEKCNGNGHLASSLAVQARSEV